MSKVTINHRVSLAGKVTNAQTDREISLAQVRIADAPEAFVNSLITIAKLVVSINEPPVVRQARMMLNNTTLSNGQKLEATGVILDFLTAHQILTTPRADLTLTAVDGLFYFLNLPQGEYSLIASVPGSKRRYGVSRKITVTVSNRDRPHSIADLTLPSTNLIGKITHRTEPITLAEVRVKGSRESAFSNSKGEYILSELESSERSRTILVRAKGYQAKEKTVTLSQPGEQKTLDFELTTR